MSASNFTVDFFIRKFSKIPARLWTTGQYVKGKKRCVLGHCGYRSDAPYESARMGDVLSKYFDDVLHWAAHSVNDGNHPQFQQRTAKARILAALKWIKEQAKK